MHTVDQAVFCIQVEISFSSGASQQEYLSVQGCSSVNTIKVSSQNQYSLLVHHNRNISQYKAAVLSTLSRYYIYPKLVFSIRTSQQEYLSVLYLKSAVFRFHEKKPEAANQLHTSAAGHHPFGGCWHQQPGTAQALTVDGPGRPHQTEPSWPSGRPAPCLAASQASCAWAHPLLQHQSVA